MREIANKQSFASYKRQQKIVPYLFLLPNLIIFTVFIILPAIMGLYYSFTDANMFDIANHEFIWFDNYIRLASDAAFWKALGLTVLLVLITVPLIYVFSLGLAMLVIKPLKAKGLFRASYYWPVMISAIVVGQIWQFILGGDYGAFNNIMLNLGIIDEPFETFINPYFAYGSVVFAKVWSRSGYYMIIFMAALLSIPTSLYEAADVDGATKSQKFWQITYPSLKASRVMVLILVIMEIFKTYPIVVRLTGGAPSYNTRFVVQYIYERAFTFSETGYSSAMSMVLLLIVTVVTGAYFYSSRGGTD